VLDFTRRVGEGSQGFQSLELKWVSLLPPEDARTAWCFIYASSALRAGMILGLPPVTEVTGNHRLPSGHEAASKKILAPRLKT